MPNRLLNLSLLLLLAVMYALLVHLESNLAATDNLIVTLRLSGGIAVATLLSWRKNLWPAVIAGEMAARFVAAAPMATAFGNTLEILCAVWIMESFRTDFQSNLNTVTDFLSLAFSASIAACIGALFGTLALWQLGTIPMENLFINTLHHWQTDMLGIIVGTPLLLVWRQLPQGWLSHPRRVMETLGFMGITFVLSGMVFLDWFYDSFGLLARGHWLFLLLLWAAFRFGRHGVSLLLTIVAVTAFSGAVQHKGFFGNDIQLTGLQNFWCYQLVLALVGMLLVLSLQARRQTEAQLLARTEELDSYFDNAIDLLCIADMDGYFRKLNNRWQQVLGYEIAELKSKPYLEFVHPDDIAGTMNAMASLMEQKPLSNFVNRYRHLDGSWRWLQWNSYPKGHLLYATARDITIQKTAEDELRLAALVYQNSSEAMMITDADNRIISINPAFTVCTGYTADDVLGENPRILSSGRHTPAFYDAMWQALNTVGRWEGEIYNRRKNADIYAEWAVINTVFNQDGSVHRRVALFSDITEKKKSEELIWFQANYDPLTQLPNRRLFTDRLKQELIKSRRDKQILGLLFIDLDRFKEVNDSMGHSVGDELLVQVARRLSTCVRKSDTVARLGGDEFTVIVTELNDYTSIEIIAQHILSALEQPFSLGDSIAYVSASIGITQSPIDTGNFEDLIRYADQAMYSAKNKGRNCFCFFTPVMQAHMERHVQIARDLRAAITQQQFEVYYQPIVDLATNRLIKAEALIRWRHPQQGLITPGDFIPVAEETGIINDIGDWVFEQAAQQVRHWRQNYQADFQISINKSPVQFHAQDGIHNHWTAILQQMNLSGDSIVVEITEGLLLDAGNQVGQQLRHFRECDIQIAIDDFGTGYSALAYLEKFHIDYLKIDQSFTRNLSVNSSELALCEAIIVMAHKLGMKVIAEGIETELQRDLLIQAGCDFGQGYLFSRPIPAKEFEALFQVHAG